MQSTTSKANDTLRTLGAFALIGLGGLFLATNVFGIRIDIMSWLWPFFVIVPGAVMLFAAYSGGKQTAGLAFPGAIVTGTGAILFFQNVTGYWESWAYAWALYPAFVGAALVMEGSLTKNENNVRNGRNMVRLGAMLFVAFGAFFELFIFNDIGSLSGVALPLVLVGVGVYMLLSGRRTPRAQYVAPAKRKNDGDVNPDLRRKIDEALAEDEEVPVR